MTSSFSNQTGPRSSVATVYALAMGSQWTRTPLLSNRGVTTSSSPGRFWSISGTLEVGWKKHGSVSSSGW